MDSEKRTMKAWEIDHVEKHEAVWAEMRRLMKAAEGRTPVFRELFHEVKDAETRARKVEGERLASWAETRAGKENNNVDV